ncbi:MAG TPA: BON domain-containing protein [Gammaproteobacteria bacterium]|nr:BON domain-containing protein [Gammaproteobacteria bacterium]
MVAKFRVLALLPLTFGAVLTFSGCASNKQSDQPMLGQRVGAYVDDSYLTSAVKTKLLGDIALKSFDIHVVTKAGVVMLSGSLPNTNLRDEAIRTAKSVGGVRDVVSEIKISSH